MAAPPPATAELGRLAVALRAALAEGGDVGDVLRQAKATAPHGAFTPWLREVGITSRRAQRAMAGGVAKSDRRKCDAPKSDTVSHLPPVQLRTWPPARRASEEARVAASAIERRIVKAVRRRAIARLLQMLPQETALIRVALGRDVAGVRAMLLRAECRPSTATSTKIEENPRPGANRNAGGVAV